MFRILFFVFFIVNINIWLTGCTRTPPVTAHQVDDGMDFYVTQAYFAKIHPEVFKRERSKTVNTSVMIGGFDTPQMETTRFVIHGYYDAKWNHCFVLCEDPTHLSEDELNWLTHEHAHRIEYIYGFEASVPLWLSLSDHYRTHGEINAKLLRYLSTNERRR